MQHIENENNSGIYKTTTGEVVTGPKLLPTSYFSQTNQEQYTQGLIGISDLLIMGRTFPEIMVKQGIVQMKKRPGAPLGNQNNKKPDDEVMSAHIEALCRKADLIRWKAEAKLLGMTWAGFVRYKMDKQIIERL